MKHSSYIFIVPKTVLGTLSSFPFGIQDSMSLVWAFWTKECTWFFEKKLQGTNLNVVVRIALEIDEKGLKNSVMTFYRIRERNLRKMIEKNSSLMGKNSVLYKKE